MSFGDILLQNHGGAWVGAALTFVGLLAFGWLVRLVAAKHFAKLARRTKTNIDDALLLLIQKTNLACIAPVALWVAQKALELPEAVPALLRTVAIVAAFLQIALWGNALITFLFQTAAEGKAGLNISARRALANLGRVVLWSLVLTLLLENLGVRLTPLLAGAGIAGVAMALALQNVLGDIFCYVAIILDRPFVAGDFIIVGDLMGSVERIGLRTTKVRSLSGELLIFSNRDLTDSRIRNYKTLTERRVVFHLGVTYQTPPDKLRRVPQIVKEVLSGIALARLDRVHFQQLGDFSLTFEVVYHVLDPDYNRYMEVQQEINLELVSTFGREGIEFAYPTQFIYTRNA